MRLKQTQNYGSTLTGPKRVKKMQNEFLKSVGKRRRSISKKHFVHEVDGYQKLWNRCRDLNLYFSTNFDRLDVHKVSLNSPRTGLLESAKKLGLCFSKKTSF